MNVAESAIYQSNLQSVLPPMDALRGKTVLVTGATGMIGACLIDLLALANREQALGMRLIALCRNAERAKARFGSTVQIAAAELGGTQIELPEVDAVIHAASNAHPMAFSMDPVGTMRANLLGTMQILEHLRVTGGRMLFVSTGEIYGENPEIEGGFSEEDFGKIDPMNPRACYPESKRAAETLCASYARQYGVDALAARLCYVYGPTVSPSNTRADAQFLRKALRGEDIVLKSAGSQMRSYCYVADAAAALVTLLTKGETANAYNVANRSCTHTIREYAETLASLAGVRVTFDLPPETERQGYSAVMKAVQNPGKLEKLGWCARFSLKEGLEQTLRILRETNVDVG